MSRYGVTEVFRTIQGEGKLAGMPAVFVRFSGCNLWSGHHLHREDGKGMCSLWCDTDFQKGVALGLDDLLGMMQQEWPVEPGSRERWCVLTGGEPALQVDRDLVVALRELGWRIAIETNGTVANEVFKLCDHVCLSPKLLSDWKTLCGDTLHDVKTAWAPDEVKVVLPGAPRMSEGWSDLQLDELESWARALPLRGIEQPAFYAQPQDPVLPGPDLDSYLHGRYEEDEADVLRMLFNTAVKRCVSVATKREGWRVSFQVHKWAGMR